MKVWKICAYLILSFVLFFQAPRPIQAQALEAAMRFYETQHQKLGIPPPRLSYEDELKNLGTPEELQAQEAFFDELSQKLSGIDPGKLNPAQSLEYAILAFETKANQLRIRLSKAFMETAPEIHNKGLYHIKGGKDWYRYRLLYWTSTFKSPEEIVAYGKKEVTRIKAEMQKIKDAHPDFDQRVQSGEFLVSDIAQIEKAFQACQQRTNALLPRIMPDYPGLPPLKIKQIIPSLSMPVPGYYRSNTFFYNVFDQDYDIRQVDWLLLHEGNPGHHFQLNYESTVEVPPYRQSLSYSGFREGWAAYIEELAFEINFYASPYHLYSKWEWDLIRSVRLILDVGINYQGWSNEKALQEWNKYIQDQDKVGLREIKRMRRWPAQVFTYKLGAQAILDARAQEKKNNKNFSLKAFHHKLLSQRSIPVEYIANLFKS